MSELKDEIKFLESERKRLKEEAPMKRAVLAVHTKQIRRIFERGLDSDNSKIGRYNSTTPLYINPKNSPKSFPTRGKTGRSRFNSGKSHKTGYFKGYKQFRQSIGREANFVNLRLSNDLQSDFANSASTRGIASPKPRKLGKFVYVLGVSRQENAQKLNNIESKYGDVFGLSKGEQDFYLDTLSKEYFGRA